MEVTQSNEALVAENSSELMSKLCSFIYNYSGADHGRIRTRAILCHIYHHALHDNWFEARDLMLMSHLQETIQFSDVDTQVHTYSLLISLPNSSWQ